MFKKGDVLLVSACVEWAVLDATKPYRIYEFVGYEDYIRASARRLNKMLC